MYSSLAGQDEKLAQRVLAGKVLTGIGLCKTGFLGTADKAGEAADAGDVGGEDLVERAGDNGLYGEDAVRAVGSAGDGLQHGQGGTYGGLVTQGDAVFQGGGVHGGELRERHGKGATVGRHNTDAGAEDVRVARVEGLAVCAVHKDGPLGRNIDYGVYVRAAGVDDRAALQVYAVALAVGLAHYGEALAGAGCHGFPCAVYHPVQSVGHGSVSSDEQRNFANRQFLEKGPVDSPEGLVHHCRTYGNGYSFGRFLYTDGRYSLLEKGLFRGGLAVRTFTDKGDDIGLRSHSYPAGLAFLADNGVLPFRGEGVADFDVYAFGHCGGHSGSIKHFGAVSCHLQGGIVAHSGDGSGRWNLLRVSRHDAGNIGPNLEGFGLDGGGVECGAIV